MRCAAGFRQALYATIAADLLHGTSFGALIGAVSLFIGAGAGIGPRLGGVIHDLTGSYRNAFWIAQVLAFFSICFNYGWRERGIIASDSGTKMCTLSG